MAGISKYCLIFHNRILSFDEDIEIIDILCTANKSNALLPDTKKMFAYMDEDKHKRIYSRKNTITSKKIVINHLKATVYSAYIKDIFEELTSYLKNILYEAALISKDPRKAKRLLGENNKISIVAIDILQSNSLEELTMKISEQIIQALENERSTKELIRKICNKIDLDVDDSIINAAMPYLELRHKLVHADGKLDDDFKHNYPQFSVDRNGYVILNIKLIQKAKKEITNLVDKIDNAAIKKGILELNTP